MRIVLETEDRIRLQAEGDGFAFEAVEGGLSPFHLLAAGLAACTHAVLHGWAEHAKLPLQGLEIAVGWEIGDNPLRITAMDMEITWPGLPPERRKAAVRAAAQCTIHNTLHHGTTVETRVANALARTLDDTLEETAREADKTVIGLETPEEHIAVFNDMSMDDQLGLMMDWLATYNKGESYWTSRRLYLEGDRAGLAV